MPGPGYSAAFRYSTALLAVAGTLGLYFLVEEHTTVFHPFLLFAAPVLFVSWCCGTGAGLLATALSALSIQYFFISAQQPFRVERVSELLPVTLFVVEGAVISLFAAARKKAEENVQTIKRELESRIDARSRELEATHDELRRREALAALGTAVSKVAHELANPLNALFTSIQLLERYTSRQFPTDRRLSSIAQDATEAAEQMQSLIKELRELSKPVTLNLAPLNLADAVAEVIQLRQPPAIQIDQSIPSALPLVMADKEKLNVVLTKLWQNAIEAMPSGGALKVKAYNSVQQVCVEIQDTGIGIPKQMDVFAPFTTSKREGWGLGLTIVRNIVLAHNGTVEYTSEAGEGTTFKLCLPAAGSAASVSPGNMDQAANRLGHSDAGC
jgi:signal transduction histidine kinase